MNSLKPLHWVALTLALGIVAFAGIAHFQYFGSISFLGAVFLVEVIIACLWKYDERFFILLMIAFLWAGMHVPLQDAWTSGRWVVLSVGALVGYAVWMNDPRRRFRLVHLLALFCVASAFVSATVSPFLQMSAFKGFSLLLLFLYCAAGARLAVLGREDRFFRGLLLGCEMVVYGTAICYFVTGQAVWGNPNSLGAAMSIGIFPVLLWGWLTSDGRTIRFRRLVALILCTYLIVFSMARAGIISIVLVTLIFCFCLHQYKLLARLVGLALLFAAVTGVFAPDTLSRSFGEMTDAILYKGHKNDGVLGSRRSPWEKSLSIIKEHPWFGTGYGTSPTGEDPGLNFGKFASSSETSREHGSGYITLAEWVGLLGVLPFVALLVITARNVWRVCVWMNRTSNARHYSIPVAMVVLSGLLHANFEDWLFAVGAYPCVYFWVFAFLLADLMPSPALVQASPVIIRSSTLPASYEAVASSR